MKVIIFTRYGAKLPKYPERPGLEFQHVQFESSNLEDLMVIAKYRILEYPTSIIINKRGQVLLKVKGSIPDRYVDNLLNH